MIGQLPPEFFTRFFNILDFDPAEAEAFQDRINNLCQRAFLNQQLDVLPDMEQQSFTQLLNQDGIAASTINEFLEDRIEQPLRQTLWEQALLQVWQEILQVVGKNATLKQKNSIRDLLRQYSPE